MKSEEKEINMVNEQIDQSSAYGEYFEAVRNFNRANDEYLRTIDQITNNRKLAIQKAIEIQINPLLSKVRGIQAGSIIVGIFSLIFFLNGWSRVSNLTNINQISDAVMQGGIGIMLILGSLGVGSIAVIVVIWTLSKINSLNLDIQKAQETANRPFLE